jgi:plasmid segregation protein ParM
MVIDIGGFTADYLLIKQGQADLSACDSLENGVIILYNAIKSRVNSDLDMLLDESDIDVILKEEPHEYNDGVKRIVNEKAQIFISDLFGKLRERSIDLRSGKVVFVGGGSILLKKQIEKSGKVLSPIFIDKISANTKGYDLLYKASKARR